MKLYKNKIKKVISVIALIVVIFNAILLNNYNVRAENTEEIEIKEIGTFHKENIAGSVYYIQSFSVTSQNVINEYNININNFPKDTKILDKNNNEIITLNESNFKIAIPHKNIGEVLNCIVDINGTQYDFIKETNISKIITKLMYQNGVAKPNSIIEIKQGENLIATTVTNENGIASFSNLYPGRYAINEKDMNGNIIEQSTRVLDLLYQEEKNVNIIKEIQNNSNIIIQNEKKKGNIEVHITDGEDKNILLSNVEVEIYNSNGDLVETITTNEDGIAKSSRLPIEDIYKVKQKTTWQDYVMDFGYHEAKFSENDELIIIEIENVIQKNNIRITKVDKDNNEIKLEGVIFGIYSSNNELLEEITTDRNGEAVSKRLPINKTYYVKEIKALDNYVLDETVITVFLSEENKDLENNIGKINTNKLSKLSNYLIIENQKIYTLLPKFGC